MKIIFSDHAKKVYNANQRFSKSGSHAVYVHEDGRRITISVHPVDTIGAGLLTKIIKKDLQITKAEFVDLLKK